MIQKQKNDTFIYKRTYLFKERILFWWKNKDLKWYSI